MPYKITQSEKGIIWIEVNNSKNLDIKFCNFGASVYSISYFSKPMILEIKDKEVFLKSPQFFGKTLGQVAGRITKKGKLNDIEYNLKAEEKDRFCLHGGEMNSLSFRVWDYRIKETDKFIDVIFLYKTRENDNGFPGKANIKIKYRVSKIGDTFSIIFNTFAKNTTLINLSNHIYWNLNNSKNVDDYSFKMNASYCGTNAKDLFIEGKEKVPDFLDFTRSKKLKKPLDYIDKNLDINTIDHTFIFDGLGKATLKDDYTIITLKTNLPAMNIYVDSSMTPIEFKNGERLLNRRGIALEPQKFVHNFNSLILEEGKREKYYIKYSLRRRK